MSTSSQTAAAHSVPRLLTTWLRRGLKWIDERATRERALLLLVSLAVLCLAWKLLLMDPLRGRRAAVVEESERMRDRIEALERQAEQILALSSRDPNVELRRRSEQLAQEIGVLDARIQEHTVTLVPPEVMAQLLELMLDRDGNLTLVRLENRGVEPVLESAQADKQAMVGVFRHRFELEVRGSYLGVLGYLGALEELPWKFFWEGIDYTTAEHPDGRATIRAYTLSAEEAWIGA